MAEGLKICYSIVVLYLALSRRYVWAAQYHNGTYIHPASLPRVYDEVLCGERQCGNSMEMQCCTFDPSNCCNKNNQYCEEESCGMIVNGWYCGDCNSFPPSTCCNDNLRVCAGQVCGLKEDYLCCDGGQRCCIPGTPGPPPVYVHWWFWVGIVFCALMLGAIFFVLWSDRLFIKYKIDKARGKNPSPPPGMPFHRRASTRIRSSFRGSRQAVQRASMRVSQRRKRPRALATGRKDDQDNPEVTHITGPPPDLDGPRSLKTQQSPTIPPSSAPSSSEGKLPGGESAGGRGMAKKNMYPRITPADDLTPKAEVVLKSKIPESPSQSHNPPANPSYNPSQAAKYYAAPAPPDNPQPQHHYPPPGSGYPRGPPPSFQGRGPAPQEPNIPRGPSPPRRPYYETNQPPRPQGFSRGPPLRPQGYPRGPPPRPQPGYPRGPPPQRHPMGSAPLRPRAPVPPGQGFPRSYLGPQPSGNIKTVMADTFI